MTEKQKDMIGKERSWGDGKKRENESVRVVCVI